MQRRPKRALYVTSDDRSFEIIEKAIASRDLQIKRTNRESVLRALDEACDGIIVDVNESDAGIVDLLEDIQSKLAHRTPPVVLYGNKRISEENTADLYRLARVSAIRFAQSLERLLDETALLLHRAEDDLSEEQGRLLAHARQADPLLANKTVLVVDDDLRNIFALTSVLEQRGITVLHAEHGREGIELLNERRDVDMVLMDIMMPEMDGYETMRAIRRVPEFESLPIIALTAKAMKGDREKCLQAGASDYVAKPVDLDYLYSVMRVWMSRKIESSQIATNAS
jgi:CheY-like chemotaxis protein